MEGIAVIMTFLNVNFTIFSTHNANMKYVYIHIKNNHLPLLFSMSKSDLTCLRNDILSLMIYKEDSGFTESYKC